jgi:hypothetical protein
MVSSRYHPRICLEGLRKAKKCFIKYIWCPKRDLNQEPPECIYRALPLHQPARYTAPGVLIDETPHSSSETPIILVSRCAVSHTNVHYKCE